MAIACLRLLTFGPVFDPVCNLPCLYSCITLPTFFWALVFLPELLFLVGNVASYNARLPRVGVCFVKGDGDRLGLLLLRGECPFAELAVFDATFDGFVAFESSGVVDFARIGILEGPLHLGPIYGARDLRFAQRTIVGPAQFVPVLLEYEGCNAATGIQIDRRGPSSRKIGAPGRQTEDQQCREFSHAGSISSLAVRVPRLGYE